MSCIVVLTNNLSYQFVETGEFEQRETNWMESRENDPNAEEVGARIVSSYYEVNYSFDLCHIYRM